MNSIASKRNRGQAMVEFALAMVMAGFAAAAGTILFGPEIQTRFLSLNGAIQANLGGVPVIINPTDLPTRTPTVTAMFSPTVVPSNTPTMTPIFSPTPAPTQTRTPTVTPVPSNTPAPTATRTATAVPTLTLRQWCQAQGYGYSWNWLTGKCMHNGQAITPTPHP